MSRAQIPTEILCMVLETVLAQESPSPFDLRLVCQRFSSLITPLLYRHVVLSRSIILSLVSDRRILSSYKLQVAHDVREYTWHITLQGDLPQAHLARVFHSLNNLREVTVDWPRTAWPASLAASIHWRPNLRLSLTNQELDRTSARLLSNIYQPQLVSCQIVGYSVTSNDRSPLQDVLLGRDNLKILHLTCTGPGVTVSDNAILQSERMPAVQELVLDGYTWGHSPATAVNFWNWSRITRLELRRVPIIPFLATVTPEHLVHLRTFKTDGFCPEVVFKFEVYKLVIRLLHEIKALESLSISLHVDHIDEDLKQNLVHAISCHGRSLLSLELGEQREDTNPLLLHLPTPPAPMVYVALLKSYLNYVVELSLTATAIEVEKQLYFPDSEMHDPADPDYATLLAGFRNLRRLKLCMKVRDINKNHDEESMIQETKAMATAWLYRLLERKEGAMFEWIFTVVQIFRDVSPDQNDTPQRCVALLSYEYKGEMPLREYLITGL